jgi:hypothetical protein
MLCCPCHLCCSYLRPRRLGFVGCRVRAAVFIASADIAPRMVNGEPVLHKIGHQRLLDLGDVFHELLAFLSENVFSAAMQQVFEHREDLVASRWRQPVRSLSQGTSNRLDGVKLTQKHLCGKLVRTCQRGWHSQNLPLRG